MDHHARTILSVLTSKPRKSRSTAVSDVPSTHCASKGSSSIFTHDKDAILKPDLDLRQFSIMKQSGESTYICSLPRLRPPILSYRRRMTDRSPRASSSSPRLTVSTTIVSLPFPTTLNWIFRIVCIAPSRSGVCRRCTSRTKLTASLYTPDS